MVVKFFILLPLFFFFLHYAVNLIQGGKILNWELFLIAFLASFYLVRF